MVGNFFFLNAYIYASGLASSDTYLNLDRSTGKRHKKKKKRKGKKGNLKNLHFVNRCRGFKVEIFSMLLCTVIVMIGLNDTMHIYRKENQ
jgi:hypothetical protein